MQKGRRTATLRGARRPLGLYLNAVISGPRTASRPMSPSPGSSPPPIARGARYSRLLLRRTVRGTRYGQCMCHLSRVVPGRWLAGVGRGACSVRAPWRTCQSAPAEHGVKRAGKSCRFMSESASPPPGPRGKYGNFSMTRYRAREPPHRGLVLPILSETITKADVLGNDGIWCFRRLLVCSENDINGRDSDRPRS